MNVSEMMERAAENLAATAGRWNDARKKGYNAQANRLNDVYAEKVALLREMGFSAVTDCDEDGYAEAVKVCCLDSVSEDGAYVDVPEPSVCNA